MTYPYEPTHGWGPDLSEFLAEGRTAWSDEYRESKHADEFECCIVCGRRTTTDKGITVLLGGGGDALLDPRDAQEAEDNDPGGFMGAWMVGPECGKRIPAEFRVEVETA